MPGPAPKEQRRRRNVPARGEWKTTPGVGWQHGPIPEPPEGLTSMSLDAWRTWMGSWFAAHWTPGDLPGLRVVIRLYNEVVLGRFQRSTELRLWMDTFGVTPKGATDRRWRRAESGATPPKSRAADPYGYLRLVDP